MTDEIIPGDLRYFILRYIDSVGQLEALLLLRANPSKDWKAEAIANRLYISREEAQELLNRLCANALLACSDDLYRYGDPPEALRTMIDRLVEAYARHLIPVTSIIHSKPPRIHRFADAFKFRKGQ